MYGCVWERLGGCRDPGVGVRTRLGAALEERTVSEAVVLIAHVEDGLKVLGTVDLRS